MRRSRSLRSETGTSVFEFLLVLPVLVFVMVGFIGLGWTLVLRQHGLVAARNAAFYQRLADDTLSSSELSMHVSSGREQWSPTVRQQSVLGEFAEVLGEVAGDAADFFETVLGDLAGRGRIDAEVQHAPQGLVPRTLGLGTLGATYSLPGGTFTSDDSGAFFSLLTRHMRIVGVGF